MKFRRFVLTLLVLALSVSFLAITAGAATQKPAAPVVKVTNVASSGEIRLSWEKVEGAESYQVYRASSQTGTYKKIKTTTASALTNTAANPGETYWYYVKAVTSGGTASAASNKVKGTCKLPQPKVTLSNIASSGKIKVSWETVEGAEKYRVYRATSKNGTYTCLTTTTATSMNNTSAVAGETYYYKVKAMHSNTAANSADSAVKSRTCDLPRTKIKLENVVSSGKIRVSWDTVEGAVKYQVYRSVNQQDWTLLLTTAKTSMINASAEAGTKYYYRVRAVAENTDANSAYSEVKNRMCDLPQTELTLSNDAATGRIKISWTAVNGAVEYKVYRSTAKNGEYSWFVKTTQNSCVDKTSDTDKTYYYKVRAVASNDDASSALSAAKTRQIKLARPEIKLENVASTGKIKVSWNAVEGAVKYQVYRSVNQQNWTLLLTTAKTSMINSSAVAGTQYYYRVRAVAEDTAKNSAYSEVKSRMCDLPQTELTLSHDETTGRIRLEWTPVEGAVEYKVYRCATEDGEYSWFVKTAETSCIDKSAAAGTVYYYKIRAVASNDDASSALSAAKTLPRKLARPSIKLENVASSGKIKVSWNAVEGAVKYQVYRSVNQQSWSLLLTTAKTSMINNNAVAETEYYYRVRAVAEDTANNSVYSEVKSRICDLPQTELSLVNDDASGRVRLSWTPVEGAVEYKVYRCDTEDGEYSWFVKTTETSCMDKTAEAEKTYYYKIRAVAANDEASSALSNVQSGSFVYKEGLNLDVSLDEEGKPVLKWNEVRGAESYEVYRAVDPNGKYILLGTTTNAKFSNSGAGCGVTYYFRVEAVGSDVPEDARTSEVMSITVPGPENEVPVTSYVASPNLYIYEIPADSVESIILPYMEEVKVGEAVSRTDAGSWLRVFYKDKLYYTWVPVNEEKFTTVKSSFSYTGNTQQQQDVIDLALQIWREWDVFYTNDDSSGVMGDDGRYGFDCSGYASYVLNKVMQKTVPTYRTSVNITTLYETSLLYNEGYPGEYRTVDVTLDDLQPGDILFFQMEKSQVDHCGIYLGNNEFVHCTQFWDGVCIMPIRESFAENFVAARRFIPLDIQSADTEMEINYGYVYLYAERSTAAEVLYNFEQGERVTLLYTSSNGDWGYARNTSGQEGFVLMKRLDSVS